MKIAFPVLLHARRSTLLILVAMLGGHAWACNAPAADPQRPALETHRAALAPVASGLDVSTQEDTPVEDTLPGNDDDGDALTFAIVSGPSNGQVEILDATTGLFRYSPNADFNGADSFTFNVTANGETSDAATVNIDVQAVNDPPQIGAIEARQATDEGQPLVLEVEINDVDNDNDALGVLWDFGNGQQRSDQALTRVIQTYNSPGTFNITATVSDGDQSSSVTHTVTVANVAPTLIAFQAPDAAQEGQTLAFSATAIEPGSTPQSLTYSWDMGDGNTYNGQGLTNVSHTYANDRAEPYTVSLSISEPEGASISNQAQVTVSNVAPSVRVGNVAGQEGSAIALTALVDDPGTEDPLTYTWNFGDGSEPLSGENLTNVTHTYADDGDFDVTLAVADGTDTTSVQAIAAIANVVPLLQPLVAVTGVEGTPVTLTAAANDPGADALEYCWNFGDGSQEVCGQNLTELAHTYADDGVYAVSLTVNDNDGGTAAAGTTATINNVSPTVEAGPNITSTEGQSVTFTGNATDPGADPLEYCWNFGDGSPRVCDIDLLQVSHTFTNDGQFNVILRVFDGGDQPGVDTLVATVNNVAPEVTLITPPLTLLEGQRPTLEATAEDPGADTLEFCWDIEGDGQEEACGVDLTRFESPVPYTQDGNYSATLTVFDGTDTTTETLSVTVENVRPRIVTAPTVYFDPARDGAIYLYQAEARDPGPEDTLDFVLDAPDGASVNDEGLVAWLNPVPQDEPYTFSLAVSDPQDAFDVQVWSLQVGYDDTDEDGAPDACEAQYALLDPNDPFDGGLDFDGDGQTNAQECFGGTNPLISDSPPPPTVASPLNGQVIVQRPVQLAVNNTLGGQPGTVYTFELFDDPSLSNPLAVWRDVPEAAQLTAVTVEDGDLVENQHYYWRASAFDGQDRSANTTVSTWIFSETPEAPSLPELQTPQGRITSPQEDEFVLSNPTDPEAQPLHIEVEIFAEGEEEPIHSLTQDVTPGDQTTVPIPVTVLTQEDQAYTWRARAVETNGDLSSPWSDALSFRIDLQNDVPDDPRPLSPGFLAQVDDAGLVLIARAPLDRDEEEQGLQYSFKLAQSPDFDDPQNIVAQIEGLEASPGAEVVWDLRQEALELTEDTVYHWEVQVRDREGLGGRATSRFVYSNNDGPPTPVQPLAPTSGAVLTTQVPELRWTQATDREGQPITYTVEVATDANFNQRVATANGIPDDQGPEIRWAGAQLEDDAEYFWRVRPVSNAPGFWSAPANFRIDRGNDPPAVPTLGAPENGTALAPQSPIVLAWSTVVDPEGAQVIYSVQVFDALGTAVYDAEITNAPEDAAQLSQSFDPLPSGGYVWRVAASDGTLQSAWSAPGTFSVSTETADDRPAPPIPSTSQPQPSGCAQSGQNSPGRTPWWPLMLGWCVWMGWRKRQR